MDILYYIILQLIHVVHVKKFIGDSKESSIFCDKFKSWVHPKCNNLNFIDFQHGRGSDDPWFCFKCNSDILPLGKSNN